jgi:peptide/nickel transport system permease protein
MIPTVLGVILITFVLFNVVGGSPATMTLGKHVSPRALEEFDEQRGFNKPLFFGWWAKTRALEDQTYERNAGAWRKVAGAEFVENSGLHLTRDATLPLAFPLQPTNAYRLTLTYRMPTAPSPQGSREARDRFAAPTGDMTMVFQGLEKKNIEFSKDWKTVAFDFRTGAKPTTTDLVFRVTGGALDVRALKLRRGMSQPFDSQLMFYLRQLAHLDFGVSSSLNQPVSQLLLQGAGPSLLLTTPIFLGEVLLAILLALLCAYFRNSWIDRTLVVLAVALMSINYLVWIVGGQYVLGYRLGWFPVWGFVSWHYLLLPVLVGIISGVGVNLRFYRTVMLDEMYKDYLRTAVAKGVSKAGVLFKHVLKNAMIPIVTNVVIAIPFLYTGSLLLESFFGIPGLGYLGVNAINSSDVDVVRAEVFIGAVLFVIANLVTDLLYAWLDPRVRLE